MKKIMIIAALIIVAATMKAEDRRSTSTLLVSVFDSKPLTVMVNGSEYDGNSRVLITDLTPGRHKVKVTREFRSFGRHGQAGFTRTLFNGWVNVPVRSKVTAKVTRNRSVQTQVVKLGGNGHSYGHPQQQNNGQHSGGHDHYGSQTCTQACPAFVFECTSGQPSYTPPAHNCDHGCTTDYPHGAPIDRHDHYGSQDCTHACPAFDHGEYGEQNNPFDGPWDNGSTDQSCDDGCSAQGHGHDAPNTNENWDGQYGNDGYGQPVNSGMDSHRFEQLLRNVEEAGFESTRYEIAKHTVQNEALSTSQTAELLRLFEFENSKVQLAKLAYDNVVDPENFLNVTSEFTFSSSTTELIEYMNA